VVTALIKVFRYANFHFSLLIGRHGIVGYYVRFTRGRSRVRLSVFVIFLLPSRIISEIHNRITFYPEFVIYLRVRHDLVCKLYKIATEVLNIAGNLSKSGDDVTIMEKCEKDSPP
jgi:hypothetical protein